MDNTVLKGKFKRKFKKCQEIRLEIQRSQTRPLQNCLKSVSGIDSMEIVSKLLEDTVLGMRLTKVGISC